MVAIILYPASLYSQYGVLRTVASGASLALFLQPASASAFSVTRSFPYVFEVLP